jgi:hypothetical protein
MGFYYWSPIFLTIAIMYLALRIILQIISRICRETPQRKKSILPLIIDITLFILNLSAIYQILEYDIEGFKLYFSFIIIVLITNLTLSHSVVFPPMVAHYIIILEKVTYTTLKALLSYIWIILLLSFAFQIVFHESVVEAIIFHGSFIFNNTIEFNNFENFGSSFVKTLTMLSGEYDAGSMVFRNSNFVLFFFFLLVAIILYNLINALAVADVKVR